MLLLSLTTLVGAQDGATQPIPTGLTENKPAPAPAPAAPEPAPPADDKKEPAAPAETKPEEHHEEEHHEEHAEGEHVEGATDEAFLKTSKSKIHINSISPVSGPIFGDTKVIVRGGPFAPYQQEHPEPQCKFGDTPVKGAYVQCPAVQAKSYEREGKREDRVQLCIQCENTPAVKEGHNVTFKVSLDGTFEDVQDSAIFYYFAIPEIHAIKPHHGPKDGGTTVEVWGKGFIDTGVDEALCGFGVR